MSQEDQIRDKNKEGEGIDAEDMIPTSASFSVSLVRKGQGGCQIQKNLPLSIPNIPANASEYTVGQKIVHMFDTFEKIFNLWVRYLIMQDMTSDH